MSLAAFPYSLKIDEWYKKFFYVASVYQLDLSTVTYEMETTGKEALLTNAQYSFA